MDSKRKNDDAAFFTAFALIGQLGFYIALPLVLGGIGGRYLDMTLHSSTPFATILGLLLGLAVGVLLVVRAISRLPQ